jgi:hypothetical protein
MSDKAPSSSPPSAAATAAEPAVAGGRVQDAVREKVRETALRSQVLVRDRWRAFRATSSYFQARVAMVAAWIAVSVVTLILAPPPVAPFVVERRDVSFGAADRTEVLIVNQDAGDLDEAVIEVEGVERDFDGRPLPAGRWSTKPFALPQGTKRTVATTDLFGINGQHPGYQLDVTMLHIRAGDAVVWSGVPAPRSAR